MTNLSKRIIFHGRSKDTKINNPYDFYPTPEWGIKLLLKYIDIPLTSKILEPCNGLGSISSVFKDSKYDVTTFDINPKAKADKYLDFLKYNKMNEFDVIITNPPFKFDVQWNFAIKGLEIIKENGLVILLGQITKLEGQKRKKIIDKYPLKEVLIHSKRYSINNKVGIGYAWYIWKKGYMGSTTLKII